tara:strand:- start:3793 stop:5148 length:1356 start_codon:yes stop_codon:yes gene_type:complete
MSRTIKWDEISDPISAREVRGNAVRKALGGKAYSIIQTAVVMTRPIPVNPKDYAVLMQGTSATSDSTAEQSLKDIYRFKVKLLREGQRKIPVDAALPDVESLPYSSDTYEDALRLTVLPTAISRKGYVGRPPKVGDYVVVECFYSDFEDAINLQTVEFVEIKMSNMTFGGASASRSLQGLFSGRAPVTAAMAGAAAAKRASDIQALNDKSEPAPAIPGKRIVSQMSAASRVQLAKFVLIEAARWAPESFKETNAKDVNSKEYKVLAAYWYFTFWGDSGTPPTPAKIKNNMFGQKTKSGIAHWSAIYITYIFWKAFGATSGTDLKKNFTASSAHIYYMNHPKWKIYETMNPSSGKIKAEVGDVLITVYNGAIRDVVNAHGDVVWKIAGKYAYLSGGNVGDSVTISRVVTLDADGNYIPTKAAMHSPKVGAPYYSIMKYLPKEEEYTETQVVA